MVVYVVMANALFDSDRVDSVWKNKEDAYKREREIDEGAVPWADYGSVEEVEVQ